MQKILPMYDRLISFGTKKSLQPKRKKTYLCLSEAPGIQACPWLEAAPPLGNKLLATCTTKFSIAWKVARNIVNVKVDRFLYFGQSRCKFLQKCYCQFQFEVGEGGGQYIDIVALLPTCFE